MFSEMLEINNINGVSFGTASNAYKVYNTNNDSDVFESVIDGLILERYADEDIKEYIKHLPSSKKRVATLSLIGEDHLLWTKINDLLKEEKSSYERLKSVYTLLKEYVKILDVERKKHGEILTPFKELAEPMVKLVEKYDPEFWKNKNHKVLDSSAGYGTFLILAAHKFMVGLKDEIPNDEERFKWIVENCLYYGELQAKSVFSWLVAIDPHNEYKTNIYWGSFLTKDFDDHMNNVWKVESFDLIIQNPPYQEQKPGFTKTQPLWHLFVHKSLILLKEGGYLVMVHPSGWRNVDGVFKETQNLLKSKQILELHIHNEKEGLKTFGAETRYDYYILCNKNYYKETIVRCQDKSFDSVDISKMEFIPNGMFLKVNELIAKEGEEKVEILYSRSAYGTDKENTNREETQHFKYPCMYTVPKGDIPNLFYSSVNDKGHFGISKLIWSNGRIISVGSYIDEIGEFGLTQFSYAIVDSVENLKNIKKAFDSKEFRSLMEICAVGDMTINRKSIGTFRKDFWKEFI
jgi:hypothetical protein